MIPQRGSAVHPYQALSLGILAGGRAQRLEGRDKGMLGIAGETLVGGIVARWSPWCATTHINSPRHPGFYRHFADSLVCDAKRDGGPCFGIAALLSACSTPWMLIAPTDLRAVPETLPGLLMAQSEVNPRGLYVENPDGRHQMVMLLPSSALPAINRFLDDGQRSARALIETLGLTAYKTDSALVDIDTPADL